MESNKEKRSPESSAQSKGNAKKQEKGGVLSAVSSRTPSDDKASLCASLAKKTHPTKSDAVATDIASALVSYRPNGYTKRKPSTATGETSAIKSNLQSEQDHKCTSYQQPEGLEQLRETGNDGAKSPSPQDIVSNQQAVRDSAESSFTTASSNAEDAGQKQGLAKKETSIIPTLSPMSKISESKKSSKPEDEAKVEGQRAADQRQSTTAGKRNTRIPALKKHQKHEAPGQNKAVQATLPEITARTAPPIHILLSPSFCGLCDSNTRTLNASQFSRPAATSTTCASTSIKTAPRGVVKKTVTTTRRVKHGGRNSLDDDEDITKEAIEVVGGSGAPSPKQKVDSVTRRPPVASSSVSGKSADNGLIKKTVTTTRQKKGIDKYEDSADVIEETIKEFIGQPRSEDAQHRQNGDSKAGGTASFPSPKENKTAGALKKTFKTTHPPKNRGRRNDSYELVSTEIVELCDDGTVREPRGSPVPPPTITGVVRDASTSQYRYAELRRPASASVHSPWNPQMWFRSPGHKENPTYKQPVAPACPIHQHGAAQHNPGGNLASVLQRMPMLGAAWSMLPGCHTHVPADSQTCSEGYLRPFFGVQTISAPISVPGSAPPCCGLPKKPCTLHDDSQAWSPPCDCCVAAPWLATNGCAGIPDDQDNESEGTYDVFYYAEPTAAEEARFAPGDAVGHPIDVIWETSPRNDLIQYSRIAQAAAPSLPSFLATHRRGSGIHEAASGPGQAYARDAGAVTDVSLSARRQVTRHSAQEAAPFFYLS